MVLDSLDVVARFLVWCFPAAQVEADVDSIDVFGVEFAVVVDVIAVVAVDVDVDADVDVVDFVIVGDCLAKVLNLRLSQVASGIRQLKFLAQTCHYVGVDDQFAGHLCPM